MLGLPRRPSPSWYRDRLREELKECRLAKTGWQNSARHQMSSSALVELSTKGFRSGNCARLLPLAVPARVYAGNIHFTLDVLPNSRSCLQRSSLRLGPRSSESQQRLEASRSGHTSPVWSPAATSMTPSFVETCYRRLSNSAEKCNGEGIAVTANGLTKISRSSVIFLLSLLTALRFAASRPRFLHGAPPVRLGACV